MITVFLAKSIITMNASMPRAEAVAVRDGKILETGTLESLQPWLSKYDHKIDEQFKNSFIIPGLIDPHLHPSMAAVLLPTYFITAMEWKMPWGTTPATRSAAEYDERLKEALSTPTHGELFITWGHHALWHGPISRSRINSIDSKKPIIVWNRSFHELCMNDAALDLLDIKESDVKNATQIDFERGRFYEIGLGYAIQKLNPYILAPEVFKDGLLKLKEVVHFGGQTTIADMAVGLFDLETELKTQNDLYEVDDNPFRVELVAHSTVMQQGNSVEDAEKLISELPSRNSHRLNFRKRVKLFTDGAFFAQVAQLLEPGYIDGHQGEWLSTPEQFEENTRVFWNKGYAIHVHCTGDLGLELAVDTLEKMQEEKPRFNHGFTIEHFGFSTPEQVFRLSKLGANISANVYYVHELSEIYSNDSVGFERASSMARIGSSFREGITTTLHSDFTMAPAQPLMSMWVAVNRINEKGNLMCQEECITPQQGLEAITINAARVLGLDHEIGSIRAGKKADFTILEEDPLNIDPIKIKDIDIKATVFEGKVFSLKSQ
ncbi:MAG TPA: amidohydrolase [Gammaproteobacteria bacterium]|jgi:predicted amidohydrolase YtcJ|nr:amidohydrolase [Gammaproteobacteria bacterium]HIK72963.1 amidohydrolase [Gammaproteobacteria bacterium]